MKKYYLNITVNVVGYTHDGEYLMEGDNNSLKTKVRDVDVDVELWFTFVLAFRHLNLRLINFTQGLLSRALELLRGVIFE